MLATRYNVDFVYKTYKRFYQITHFSLLLSPLSDNKKF